MFYSKCSNILVAARVRVGRTNVFIENFSHTTVRQLLYHPFKKNRIALFYLKRVKYTMNRVEMRSHNI